MDGKICENLTYGESVKMDEKTEKAVSSFLDDYWKKHTEQEAWQEPTVTAYSLNEKTAMKRFSPRIPSAHQPLPKGEYLEVVIEKKRKKPVLGGGTFHLLIDSKSSKVLCFGRDR
ncbi:hypothetical protein CXU22_03315 [Akkermansia muciniphila]|uniref:Uncharacterized protein n=2 Tax=Akkermansia muciniphila TaxID=239935 RepID=A0A2N8HEY6_9BACT|nr:hypothetical protein CXU22_03315 [Akkermansia muciniphila]